jgi:hypothetical protein
MMSYEILGWIATACFMVSYFMNARMLRVVQGLAAGLWIVYGASIQSMPVITANSLVVVFSLASMLNVSVVRKKTPNSV